MSSQTRPERSRRICVDASVALKLVLDEEDSDKAHALWASWVAEGLEIIAPCHLAFEVTSARPLLRPLAPPLLSPPQRQRIHNRLEQDDQIEPE